jgi:PPM family protein phosphatase
MSGAGTALLVSAGSHRGHRRERNEDAVGVQGWTTQRDDGRVVQLRLSAEPSATCVVADGMGGQRAGHIASRLAAELISGDIAENSSENVFASFARAHERIRAAASVSSQLGMGTTVVALSLAKDSIVVANVGDSRLYEITDGPIVLSHDDNPQPPPGVVHEGPIHVLSQALGAEQAPSVHLDRLPTEDGLRFLLCSDGLTDVVDDTAIERLCAQQRDDAGLVASLIAAALEAGGPDNVTVAVARVAHVTRPHGRAQNPPTARIRS